MEIYDSIIIGAGISGLSLAQNLKGKLNFAIIEKSKGLGGRIATRRINGQPVDHGAQYFTCQDQGFKNFIEDLERKDAVSLWTNKFKIWDGKALIDEPEEKKRYICRDGMTQLAKEMASDLPILRGLRVESLEKQSANWLIKTDQGQIFQAEKIISTAPLPQSLDLAGAYLTDSEREKLALISYNSCLCLILIYDSSLSPGFQGVFWNADSSSISWIANDSSKRESPNQTVLIIHCDSAFSERHFDSPEEEVFCEIFAELKNSFLPDWINNPLSKQLKKWRYSQAASAFGQPYLQVAGENLFLTGDWALSSKVESSYIAGRELSEKILSF